MFNLHLKQLFSMKGERGNTLQWLAFGILLLLASIMIIKGGYMQAKAHFAQYLIERAFIQTLVDNKPHKPWSWADTHPVAKMRFMNPKLKSVENDLYILAGMSGRTLAFGPGLFLGGAGAGEQGNTIIAGHRDSHFSRLKYLQLGDVIELQNTQGNLTQYRVTDLRVVHESQVEEMAKTEDSRLTLITCYPFESLSANANLRYIVEAKAMPAGPKSWI
ncbi:class GN sortase [Shewanella holmiensis]|uniref:Class GN sortase n=1 Tax=Shewanella holmiensis TaxID=2952222 RepID=A0A9X2WMY1_9GAMM|nr:class GN sortase [Shewanella holmiensis]MCT7942188.1 class GN sortase [Shewanella holmiensis]